VSIELYINRFRILMMCLVYGLHLLNFVQEKNRLLNDSTALLNWEKFNLQVSVLVAAWIAMTLLVNLSQISERWQRETPWISAGIDSVLMCAVLITADGPRSPLVILLPVILVLRLLHRSSSLLLWTCFGVTAAYWTAAFLTRLRPEALVPWYGLVFTTLAFFGIFLVGKKLLAATQSESQ
jgi:hypothetical protein